MRFDKGRLTAFVCVAVAVLCLFAMVTASAADTWELRKDEVVAATVLGTSLSSPLRSSGFEKLDEAAVNAVQHWLFEPATENGKPVGTWIEAGLKFGQ